MNINLLLPTISCWLFTIYYTSANNNEICKVIHSKSRTIRLSTILPQNAIKIDKNIGFIKDTEKLLTYDNIKDIEQKFNIKIPSDCLKIVYKNGQKTYNNRFSNIQLLISINKYLKSKKSLNKVIQLKLQNKQVSFIPRLTITSLKQIENNIYELKMLHDNKEKKLQVALKMVSPTLVAKHNIPENSALTRKLFKIKYMEIDDHNFTLKDWQSTQLPIITTQPIKKGAVIKKDYLNRNPKITKKITAAFKCKNFTISKELQLKKIYKEQIELEDPLTKKHYLALPIGENKAIIKNIGCWR